MASHPLRGTGHQGAGRALSHFICPVPVSQGLILASFCSLSFFPCPSQLLCWHLSEQDASHEELISILHLDLGKPALLATLKTQYTLGRKYSHFDIDADGKVFVVLSVTQAAVPLKLTEHNKQHRRWFIDRKRSVSCLAYS